MPNSLNEKFIAYFALLSGISISAVAIFYSVSGLVAIYPAAMIPIIVMGVAIEVGKLSMTLWLKQNWHAPWIYKITMIPAVIILMIITSGGVFGFLSKAHSDQSLISGDALSKVQLIDDRISIVKENIETQKDNISAARTALAQLDSQVNARLGMGFDDGSSAERSVQIRRSQRSERSTLNSEITQSQNEIQRLNEELEKLNEEKAPLNKELRKVEAEVGPVKYIAALIYGDNPDSNLLERAVRWVTLLIVVVLDPVAILLLLASQYSFQTIRNKNQPNVVSANKDVVYLNTSTTTTSITNTVSDISLSNFDSVEMSEDLMIREPLKAVEVFEPLVSQDSNLDVNDLFENTSTIVDIELFDGVEYKDTEIISFEETLSLDVTDTHEDVKIQVVNEIVDTKTADSEDSINLTFSEYVQNEEQIESNLWSVASAAISQEEYLEKVRKMKGG